MQRKAKSKYIQNKTMSDISGLDNDKTPKTARENADDEASKIYT